MGGNESIGVNSQKSSLYANEPVQRDSMRKILRKEFWK